MSLSNNTSTQRLVTTTSSTTRPSSSTSTNNNSSSSNNGGAYNDETDDEQYRDIHALTPATAPAPPHPPSRQRPWDTASVRSSNLSIASDVTNSSENFTTMSREFNQLVIAGSAIDRNNDHNFQDNFSDVNNNNNNNNNLDSIGEEGEFEDINPLAIVPDSNPLPSPRNATRVTTGSSLSLLVGTGSTNSISSSNSSSNNNNNDGGEVAVHRVKKEEVETKISAWQTAKVAKINNRFKREDAVISGWENEQVHKASSWMKKVERKLEEKRAKAMEKMQNDIAKAHRKAEERRASAEAKRGTKVAKILEIANLMRAVGKPPAKRSFF